MNTEHDFLSQKIPIKPYMDYWRGPSTEYTESIHIKNTGNGKLINVFFCKFRKTVSVCVCDPSKHEREQTETVLENVANFKFTDDLFDYVK